MTSLEDSFISIKFEPNGVGSWEKNNTLSKVSLELQHNLESENEQGQGVQAGDQNCDRAWENRVFCLGGGSGLAISSSSSDGSGPIRVTWATRWRESR
ncbi:hypothetical protein FCV25MIE_02009 [Fagus crenata]